VVDSYNIGGIYLPAIRGGSWSSGSFARLTAGHGVKYFYTILLGWQCLILSHSLSLYNYLSTLLTTELSLVCLLSLSCPPISIMHWRVCWNSPRNGTLLNDIFILGYS